MSGVKPKAIFIDTNDTAAEVVVAGYLDHIVAQGIPIANWEIALVTTRPSPNSADITTSWYGITFSNGKWSLVAQGSGGGGVLTQVTVPVPSADFMQIFGTPFLLVAPPAANEFYIVHTCIIEFDYNSQFYTGGSDVLVVYYFNWAVAATVGVANTEFHGVADSLIVCAENTSIGAVAPGNVLGVGLYLAALSTDFANGDSPLRVTVTYETITTSF